MVEDILVFIEGKERRKYAKKHGISSLINYFHGLPWKGEKAEKIYKICNDQNIKWEEYYNTSTKGKIY